MQYTIQSINKDGTINVSFDIDNKTQNLSGAPIDDASALSDFLFTYGTAYEDGISLFTPPAVDPAVQAQIGKPQVAVAPTAIQPVGA